MRRRQFLTLGVIAGAVIFIDQVTKWQATSQDVTSSLNPGFSFGWGSQWSTLVWALSLFLIIFLWYSLKTMWLRGPMAAGLFFGGAISNLIDRTLYNGVRDWLVLPWPWRGQIYNNLADWAISLGVLLVIGGLYKAHLEVKKQPPRKFEL